MRAVDDTVIASPLGRLCENSYYQGEQALWS